MLEAQQPPPPALDRDAFRLSSPAPPEAAVPVAVAGSAEGDELSWLQYLIEAQQGHAMVDEKAAARFARAMRDHPRLDVVDLRGGHLAGAS